MSDGTGHTSPYEFLEMPVKRKRLRNCDLRPEEAKVVNSPKVLKMGVNSPVTSRIYP
jgi:hypothetical protein